MIQMMKKLEKVGWKTVEALLEKDCTIYPNYHQRGSRVVIKNGNLTIKKGGKVIKETRSPFRAMWTLWLMRKQLEGAQVGKVK